MGTQTQHWRDADILVVAGPTASGKSAFALALAQACNGVIINADALQLYASLRVLSARPSAAEEAATPHALYGVLRGHETGSAGRWQALALEAIATARRAGQTPILVGGTGLYLQALMHGMSPIPEIPALVREGLLAQLSQSGIDPLYQQLQRCDPTLAARLKPTDTQRILRALEVFEGTNKPLSHWQTMPPAPPLPEARFYGIEIIRERNELYDRCNARVEQMLAHGAIEEVEALVQEKLPDTHPVMRAVGVPELRAYLQGDISLDGAREHIKQMTRNYAKRQLTWLRHQWRADSQISNEDVAAFVKG